MYSRQDIENFSLNFSSSTPPVALDPRGLPSVLEAAQRTGSVSSLESFRNHHGRNTPTSSLDLEWENDGKKSISAPN